MGLRYPTPNPPPDLKQMSNSSHDRVPAPLIKAQAISLSYGQERILDAVSLTVEPGKILTVIGPNGSGKTTLLKTLVGLIRPDCGTVHKRPGLSIGYMPQSWRPDPVLPLTVRRFLKLTRKLALGRRRAVLRDVGAEHLLEARMGDLSGGETQRVMLARALLREPDLLVLDEPAQGVDAAGQLEFYRLINTARTSRHCGVLMVSHDLHLVMAQTDQVICFNRHICCSGAPAKVASDPAYRRLFGREAAEALAVYRHDPDHDHQHHTYEGARHG